MVLAAGSLVPADAVLIEARDLHVAEAALTGEAFAVEKVVGPIDASTPLVDRANSVHMGTSVRSGAARAVVVATGSRTAFGALAGRLALRPPETEFQRGLRQFGYALVMAMLVLALLVFAASAVQGHPAVDALLFAIALAVGIAPEMLPAVLNMVSMAGAALFLPFLPLLAKQVLLNNLLSDVPSATLATDHVDDEAIARPERWNIGVMSRFMLAFGLLSAVFDGLTFLTLTLVLDVSPDEFRTAWFTTSLTTELFVLLVLRTRRVAWRSRPHPALIGSTMLVATIAVALPLSPLGSALGFVAISGATWGTVVGITAAYVTTVELGKRRLLRWIERRRPMGRGGLRP